MRIASKNNYNYNKLLDVDSFTQFLVRSLKAHENRRNVKNKN